MTTKANQGRHKIYLKPSSIWVEVPEEVFRDYSAMSSNYRRKQQRHGRCACWKEKRKYCDTDCAACKFRRAGDLLSLNAETETDGYTDTQIDDIADETVNVEETVMDKDLIEALHRVLLELSPEEYEMCRLCMEGKSGREAARMMGLPRATHNRRWNRLLFELFEKLKEYI